MIPFEQMTMEDLKDNFPEVLPDAEKSIWPHLPVEDTVTAAAETSK